MELDELIKELDNKLIVISKEIKNDIMYIYCETKKQPTKCKYCGQESENVHSIYMRKISDLPILKYKVKLVIKVKKYFCSNPKCNHTTFAEPLDFVEKIYDVPFARSPKSPDNIKAYRELKKILKNN